MTTTRRGYFRYLTEDIWRSFLTDVAIALAAIAIVSILAGIAYVYFTGRALDDAVTELIVPTPTDYQLPTI